MWVREGSGWSGRVREGLEGPGRHDGSTLVCQGSLRVQVGIRLFWRVRGRPRGSCRYLGKFMRVCEGLGWSGMVRKGPIGFEQAFRDVYLSGSVRGEGV